MSYEIVTTLLLLLLALLSGAFFGCLIRRWTRSSSSESGLESTRETQGLASAPLRQDTAKSKPSVAATPAVEPASSEDATAQDATTPAALSSPRDGNPDDLQRINGVGKKLELKLNDLGVYHYDQIAGWDRGNVVYVDDHLSFKGRIDREEWIPQAKDLAQGKATDFSKTYDKKHKGKSSSKKTGKVVVSKKSSKPVAKKTTAKKTIPARGLKAAIGGKADDLKIISGVGPKLEKTLHGLGIFHFEQIAGWKAKDIAEVDDLLSFKGRIERDDWTTQAKKLAKK